MSEVKNVTWYTDARGTIGIVECFDNITKSTKFYIGIGLGLDEQEDIEYIKSHGTKFIPEQIIS